MKKITLILGQSLLALCTMAVVDVSDITTSAFPAAVNGVVSVETNVKGTIPSSNMTYSFEGDDLYLIHNYNYARHLSSTIVFDTNGHTGLYLVSTANNPNFDKVVDGVGYNYFGINGSKFIGGGEITVDATSQATPVWLAGFSIDATTVNMNLGEKVLRTAQGTFTLNNGATLNWNTSTPTQLWDQDTGKYKANNSYTSFTSSEGTARNTVNLMSGALTSVEGVGNVLYNISVDNSRIDLKFDSSLGNDITIYNTNSNGLYNNGYVYLEEGRKLTYKSSSDGTAAIRQLLGSGNGGTFVLDFNGTMAGSVGQQGTSAFTVEVASGRNVATTSRYASNNSNLTLRENASITFNPSTNVNNTNGNNHLKRLTMEKGSSLTANAGLRFIGGDINGAITVKGSGRNVGANGVINNDDFIIGFYGGVTTFGESATLKQDYQSAGAWNWTGYGDGVADGGKTTIITNSGKGSINLGNSLRIAPATVLKMNTTDAYIIGSGEAWQATSQATSIFNLAVHFRNGDAHTRFEINAANNIGAISFDASRVLEIAFGENGSLVLGEEAGEYFNSLRGDFLVDNCILLEGLVVEKLKVFDVAEADLKKYFGVLDSDKYVIDIKAIDGEANAFWVNTSMIIPEPAHWAAIFGALALAFVAYRRRR